MMEAHCARVWRRGKPRAEALYVLALLLSRECRLRAEDAGEGDTWTFDSADVQRMVERALRARAEAKR